MINDDVMGLVYITESLDADFSNTVSNMSTNKQANDILFYVTFDTNLQDFDVMNRNRRFYDKENIKERLHDEKIQSLLHTGGWFGEFDHPCEELDGEKLSPKRIQNVPPAKRAFKIMNPHFVGNVLKATIQSAQGEVGVGFGKEVLAGWVPQFSCRAIAIMVNRGNKPYVIVKKLITYDAPWYPSHKIAHATTNAKATVENIGSGITTKFDASQLTTESVIDNIITGVKSTPTDVINGITVPLTEILHDVGKTDVNVKMIMESFELDDSSLMGFGKNHRTIIIKDENNTMYTKVNPESVRKIQDFYGSF